MCESTGIQCAEVERWFRELTEKRGVAASVPELIALIKGLQERSLNVRLALD